MSENQTPPGKNDVHQPKTERAGEPGEEFDDDEIAFDWMKPAKAAPAEPLDTPRAEAPPTGPAPSTGSTAAREPVTAQRSADPAPVGAASTLGDQDGAYVERRPTAMLHRPPSEDDVAKRLAAREQAANTKPVLPRVFQVLLAVFYPVVLAVVAIRVVTSSVFLWVEYHRPGFPADSFGFSTEDRMTYGSYAVDYVLNFAPARYLGELVQGGGKPLFLQTEVSHMADVKHVLSLAFLAGTILAVVMVIGIAYLLRRSTGGIRRGLFAGSILTLVLIIALAVLAILGWETFFTDLHRLLFRNGTWTFYVDDTLIRLFPEQFWIDAAAVIGAIIFLVSTLTFAFTWPTRQRRAVVAKAQRPGRRAA